MKTLASVLMMFQSPCETLTTLASPGEDSCPVQRIKAFFRGFPACSQDRSRAVKQRVNSSPANLSSVTTPNGLWVYTVVPWED